MAPSLFSPFPNAAVSATISGSGSGSSNEFSDFDILNTIYPKSSISTVWPSSSSCHLQKCISSDEYTATTIMSPTTTAQRDDDGHEGDINTGQQDDDGDDDFDGFTTAARTAVAIKTSYELTSAQRSDNAQLSDMAETSNEALPSPTLNIQAGTEFTSPSVPYQPQRTNMIVGITFSAIILVSMLIGVMLAVRVIQRNKKEKRREQLVWLFQSNDDDDSSSSNSSSSEFGRQNWFLKQQQQSRRQPIALQRLGPSSKFSKAVRLAAVQQSPSLDTSSP